MIAIKLVKIKEKETIHHKGKVYDLLIEDEHSYAVDGLIVHNSGGGSLVNDLLGITKLDPVKYGLIFERFLNKDRGHLPDIDSDFDDVRGPEVFQHLIDKYGKEHVANVCTFSKMQLKSVIKDVARALGINHEEVNEFTKNIPTKDAEGNPIEHVDNLEDLPGAKEFIEKYPDVIKYAKKLEGTPRQQGQHPAGIGITPCEITDLIPVTRAKPTSADAEPGYLSAFEKEQFEQSGVVKLDILKIAGARQLSNMLELIDKYYKVEAYEIIGKEIKDENIPLDDPGIWRILCSCDTKGIFQMTNPKVSNPVLKKVQPKDIHELSAITSFIRPGASGLDNYLQAKDNPDKRIKIDPRIDPILDQTYGAIVFQETIMELISTIMGISFGQADIYRRAIEKPKKFPDIYKEFEDNFVKRGAENGFSERVCLYIKKAIIDNSGYSFNKSHAYAYSYLTAQMCWVKARFPLVWYAIMLDDDISKFGEYMLEAREHNIKVNPPHVSYSKSNSMIEDKENKVIRAGLSSIKGCGQAAIEIICANQPYTSINDFFERACGRSVTKKVVEVLINADAFAGLPLTFESAPEGSHLKGKEPVYLTRSQMQVWYQLALEAKTQKAEKMYELKKEDLSKRLQEDTTLVFRKKENTIIVPFSFLEEFGIDTSDEEKMASLSVTRKKPEGRLKTENSIKLPYLIAPFNKNEDTIVNSKKELYQEYIEDIKAFGFSFRKHPLAYKASLISRVKSKFVGMEMCIAGLVTNVEQFVSKKGNPCLKYKIITPHEELESIVALVGKKVNIVNYIKDWNFVRFYTKKNDRGSFFEIADPHIISERELIVKNKE